MATKTNDEATAEAGSTGRDAGSAAADTAGTERSDGIADKTIEATDANAADTTDATDTTGAKGKEAGGKSAAGATGSAGSTGAGTDGYGDTEVVGSADPAETTGDAADAEDGESADGDTEATEGTDAATTPAPAVGQGAGAVVSAGLGVVSLTGSWVGTVAAARESLMGQLETSQSAGVAKQVQSIYGDSWSITAVIGGVFALAALVVGAVVLAKPLFGVPAGPQAPWIKSVAWAGVALGVVGLLLAVAKYSDLLFALPSTSS